MTYHFIGMGELLDEAFSGFAQAASAQLEEQISGATDADAAKHALVNVIIGVVLGSQRDLVLTHELYTPWPPGTTRIATSQTPGCRSGRHFERYFDPITARILDALLEGLSIHRALDNEPQDPATVVAAVQRVTAQG